MADGPNHDLIERLKAVTQAHREMHIIERDALFAEAALALIDADKLLAQIKADVLKAIGILGNQ
jgi:hypothetical protein